MMSDFGSDESGQPCETNEYKIRTKKGEGRKMAWGLDNCPTLCCNYRGKFNELGG